jgi:hypothetical protein
MDITVFHFTTIIFALLVLLNAHMVRKQGDKYRLALAVSVIFSLLSLIMTLF